MPWLLRRKPFLLVLLPVRLAKKKKKNRKDPVSNLYLGSCCEPWLLRRRSFALVLLPVRQKFNRSHAHAAANKPLTTHTTHEHRASNGAKTTTLNSRSRRRRPQAAAQRCTSALEPTAHQRNWPPSHSCEHHHKRNS